jgi:rhodanese-related sulfurtransferase
MSPQHLALGATAQCWQGALVMTANPPSDWELFSAIRKEELSEAIAASRVQVVNVLEAPKKGRLRLIAHSRHIPLSELQARLGELDRGRDVVVYCKNRECPASLKAARLLAEQGFHVRAYEGGIEEWVAAGLPTDADAKKLPRTETASLDLAPSSRAPSVASQPEKAEVSSREPAARSDREPAREQPAATPAKDDDADAAVEERRASPEDEASAEQSAPPTARTPRTNDEAAEGARKETPSEAQAPGAPEGARAESARKETPFRAPASSFLDCLGASPPSSRSA